MSLFLYRLLKYCLWHLEQKSILFFTYFYVSHDKKIAKSLNQNSETLNYVVAYLNKVNVQRNNV